MTPTRPLLGLATALALGGAVWLWLSPRSASDCKATDHDCLRQVAWTLISTSLEATANPFISDQIDAAGRLLATEGAIDLALQQDQLAEVGFGPRNIGAVFDSYFYALSDPSYPFDIPAAIAAGTGPQDSDLADYVTSAFRLALADPARKAEALALWDRHFDQLIGLGITSEPAVWYVLSWLARHDPALAADYFKRAADARAFLAGPGGWPVFFRTAAWHCHDGRLDDGRVLLNGLRTYFPPQDDVELYLPALLACEGEDAAVAATALGLSQWAVWAENVLKDRPEASATIVKDLDDLSKDLRRDWAAWLNQQDRRTEVPEYWSRYGGAEIARRHLPHLDWLAAQLRENQSKPAPETEFPDLWSGIIDSRLDTLAVEGDRFFSLNYEDGTAARFIELDWPSARAMAAVRGLVQHSKSSPLLTAFVVGLERQLGCAPSEARMQSLLDDISALKDPLDQARAITAVLRFAPAPSAQAMPSGYACIYD